MKGKTYTWSFLCCLWSIIQFSNTLNAQNLSSIFQIGTKDSESIELLASTTNNKLIVSGQYDNLFTWDSIQVNSQGEQDCFIAQLNDTHIEWFFSAGSIGQDELLVLHTDDNNHIIACLSYLNNIQIGDTLVSPNSGSRGLVLFKLDTLGNLLWLQDINSTGEQTLTAITTDNNNQIYATGSFGGTFSLQGQSMTAKADQDMFLLKLNPFGNVLWMQQAGLTKTIRPQSLSLNTTQDSLYISGIFDGTVSFNEEILQANTNDFDVFILQTDTTGIIQWSQKAGGVFNDNNIATLVDSTNTLFVIGDFQGVLKLRDDLQITTNGVFDNNLYVLAYSSTGTPLWARSLGGTNFDFVTDAILINQEEIVVSGYFQDTFIVDEFNAIARGNFDSYALGLSTASGQGKWLKHLESEDLVIGNALAYLNEQIILGGTFTNNLIYEDSNQNSVGFFDAFLAYFDTLLTSNHTSISTDKISLSIYPNPTANYLHINTASENYQLVIFDTKGNIILQEQNSNKIAVTAFESGLYYLYLLDKNGRQASVPFVVESKY